MRAAESAASEAVVAIAAEEVAIDFFQRLATERAPVPITVLTTALAATSGICLESSGTAACPKTQIASIALSGGCDGGGGGGRAESSVRSMRVIVAAAGDGVAAAAVGVEPPPAPPLLVFCFFLG